MEEEKTDAWDATQWHEVKQGETLWKIAETCYGVSIATWPISKR